jgi:hypothetical protein
MTGAEAFMLANTGIPPSYAELLSWLRGAAQSGGVGELPAAMGLTRGDFVKARDAAMLEAAQALNFGGSEPWELAGRLADQIARFESRHWPRLKAGLSVQGLGPSEIAIHRAFRAGVGVITSRGKIYQWLQLQDLHFPKTPNR